MDTCNERLPKENINEGFLNLEMTQANTFKNELKSKMYFILQGQKENDEGSLAAICSDNI